MAFCSNCGYRLENDAQYCSKCGKAVGVAVSAKPDEKNIHCPCCGRLLSAIEVTCPCGYEIQGKEASYTIQEFLRKLDEIDKQKDSKWREFARYLNNSVSVRAERKAEFIRNYAVPNTKEDILEFLLLALPNIDNQILQKRILFVMRANQPEFKSRKIIAQAWLAKFEQVYQKARIVFGNDADFRKIQDIYDDKQVKKKSW